MNDEMIRRMYDAANDDEARTLDDVRRRAGLTWECNGGDPEKFSHWTNVESEAACGLCGRPKP